MAKAGRARWLWLALAVVAADRATKYAIERLTTGDFRRELVPHFAALVHSVNAGIAFGILGDSSAKWLSAVLMGAAAAVVLLLVWLLLAGHAGGALSQAGFALIAGGATGNLLDRLLHGGVTDFLELRAGSFLWPAFNLADSAITIGALLILLELLGGQQDSAGGRA